MEKISPVWNEYYREPEPDRRRRIFEKLAAEYPDPELDGCRQRVFTLRHAGGTGKDLETDRYLWQCVNFIQLYDTSRLFKRGARKEVESFLREGGYDEMLRLDSAGETALYWEIRNAAGRYFKTCAGPEYRKVLFGLISTGDADRKKQIARDAWKMTRGLTQRLGLGGRLDVWNRAVLDEYDLTDPSAHERMIEIISSE